MGDGPEMHECVTVSSALLRGVHLIPEPVKAMEDFRDGERQLANVLLLAMSKPAHRE